MSATATEMLVYAMCTVSNELTPCSTGTEQARTVLCTLRHITPRCIQRIHFVAFLNRILHCIADAGRCQHPDIHRSIAMCLGNVAI